jgi:hypothetical protein
MGIAVLMLRPEQPMFPRISLFSPCRLRKIGRATCLGCRIQNHTPATRNYPNAPDRRAAPRLVCS